MRLVGDALIHADGRTAGRTN